MTTENKLVDDETVLKEIDFSVLGLTSEQGEAVRKKALEHISEYDKELPNHVSKAGTFNLPPLLEKRRLEWQVPDGVFRVAGGTLYDRILIWQVTLLADSLEDTKILGGKKGILLATPKQQDAGRREASRGIIVGAGLAALDSLRSHGVDLGHIVYFAKNTVYAILVDQIAGHEERVSLAREGDLILSEDLAAAITRDEAKVEIVERKDEQGMVHREHYYVDKNGVRYSPMMPTPEDDL